MASKASTSFYWLSFLPALAYWWMEEHYPLRIALAAGIGLAVLEVTAEKIFVGKVHTLSRLNFGLLALLGGLALWADEGVWFKLQPTFTGVVCGGWLIWTLARGRSLLGETMHEMGQPWPWSEHWLRQFEWHICAFILVYAAYMAYWALWGTTSQWAFWKTGGQYLCFAVFMVGEFCWFRFKIRSEKR
jgi:intracellular septation protein